MLNPLLTTGIGSLPHTDADEACRLILKSFDIPFWPQLPHLSYYEDMYVQAAEHFPGIVLYPETNSIRFDIDGPSYRQHLARQRAGAPPPADEVKPEEARS